MKKKLNPANILLEKHLAELELAFEREFKFHPDRRWRADYRLCGVLKDGQEILVEIEGGVYTQGRHTRGKGYEADMRKYNSCQALGFRLFRFSTNMVLRGEAKAFLAEHLR